MNTPVFHRCAAAAAAAAVDVHGTLAFGGSGRGLRLRDKCAPAFVAAPGVLEFHDPSQLLVEYLAGEDKEVYLRAHGLKQRVLADQVVVRVLEHVHKACAHGMRAVRQHLILRRIWRRTLLGVVIAAQVPALARARAKKK